MAIFRNKYYRKHASQKAYAIKLYSDSDFSYQFLIISRLNNGAKIKPEYYKSVINTGDNMTIGIPKNILDEIAIYGDEIGIFDSNNLWLDLMFLLKIIWRYCLG